VLNMKLEHLLPQMFRSFKITEIHLKLRTKLINSSDKILKVCFHAAPALLPTMFMNKMMLMNTLLEQKRMHVIPTPLCALDSQSFFCDISNWLQVCRYQNTVNADMNVSVVDMTVVTEGHRFGTIYIDTIIYRLGKPVVQLGWRFFCNVFIGYVSYVHETSWVD
jgi:hypothetical protein